MFELNTLPLVANAALLVVLSVTDLRGGRSANIMILIWTVVIVVFEYILLSLVGGSRPLYQLFFLKFPLALLPLLTLVIILLLKDWTYQKWSILVAFVVLMLMAGSRPGLFKFTIASSDNAIYERIIIQIIVSIAFISCVIVPYTCLTSAIGKPWSYRIKFQWSELKRDLEYVVIGGLFFIVVTVATNIVYKGYSVQFFWLKPMSTFTIIAMLNLFYVAVFEQTICLGFASRVKEKFLPNESPSLWEIVVYAGLYASLYYYYRPGAILSQFGCGLALGYIFVKTRSLGYGIALTALIETFTN